MADTMVLVREIERKSKSKMKLYGLLFTILIVQDILLDNVTCDSTCPEKGCGEGKCVDGKCECDRGWAGEKCEKCYGRKRLSGSVGTIYDGDGNYTLDTKCSWLIQTNSVNTTFRLKFHQFSTECGWDHLYIHDGDSAFSPLLAAYSGLLMTKDNTYTEVDFFSHVHQPYIYVHFYSDAAYTMSGFNLTYSIGDCPLGCSDHGDCNDSQCLCHPLWHGDACEIPLCPNNCSNNGKCVDTVCQCQDGFRGLDCNLTSKDDLWTKMYAQNSPVGRASHTAVMNDKSMWVVGGYTLNDNNYHDLVRYDFAKNSWFEEPSSSSPSPAPRYGHSAVIHENKLYMYGGVVDGVTVSDNWMYDISTSTWTNLTASYLLVSGHTAHVFEGKIHVIFGYSPLYGYLNKVQIYDIANDTWSDVITTGVTVRGGYGHTSVWDPTSKMIYVYGGYHSGSQSSYNLTDVLYSYDPVLKKWMLLKSSGSPRYLHSAVIINGVMLVFGGNTHNDTSVSYGAKCYSSDFMAYDISCNTWYHLSSPALSEDISRYGQTMVLRDNVVYMFGGFSGIMRNDLITYETGKCEAYEEESSCTAARPGVLCMWEANTCKNKTAVCDSAKPSDQGVDCELFTSCPNCINMKDYNCSWCNNKCMKSSDTCQTTTCNNSFDFACDHLSTCKACHENKKCMWDRQTCVRKNPQEEFEEQCPLPTDNRCGTYHNCGACLHEDICIWKRDTSTCRSIFQIHADESLNLAPAVCPLPCSSHKSCSNCTSNTCMWCSNMQQCVETNSYVASFPYGQCTEWTTKEAKCAATNCSGLHSCKECQAHSMCGWCNDPSNTGLGKCVEGGLVGPIDPNSHKVEHSKCPREQWFFVDCPKCQCNGHSKCINDTSTCERCQNKTTGSRCELCEEGYYGNPKNGGKCKACVCNGQADTCDRTTGECFCRTRGVTGDKCDQCDDTHKYFGDPKSGGTCYYQLVTDYQFTFNLSKPDDHYYTQINFMNVPKASDRDVDFTLNCSGDALLNITHKSKSIPEERFIVQAHPCKYFRTKFEHKDYPFAGDENTTFRVYVYGFGTPFWLQISFSQFPKIDLVHFFVTFFSCFLSLLLIAAALWKIKHKYDSYRRRQQMIVEMQQMASRPFATVTVEIDRKIDSDKKEHKETTDFRKRKRGGTKPAAVALEPLHNAKAAILTVIIQLPTGHEEFAPCGQSGVAMGSTLITYGGNTRKQSVEHIRGDRPRLRKHLPIHHPQPDTSA